MVAAAAAVWWVRRRSRYRGRTPGLGLLVPRAEGAGDPGSWVRRRKGSGWEVPEVGGLRTPGSLGTDGRGARGVLRLAEEGAGVLDSWVWGRVRGG